MLKFALFVTYLMIGGDEYFVIEIFRNRHIQPNVVEYEQMLEHMVKFLNQVLVSWLENGCSKFDSCY